MIHPLNVSVSHRISPEGKGSITAMRVAGGQTYQTSATLVIPNIQPQVVH